MAAGIFNLKYRDTLPALSVNLKNPDGTAYNLTGVGSVTLHVLLSDGTALERAMVVSDAANGVAQYAWLATDWDTGNLVVGPTVPTAPGVFEHRMEYEVIDGSGDRLTFPNDGHDILRIVTDIGQGPP
jgi:hypothetical protein